MRVSSALFLATLFCATWEKVHWEIAGSVGIADVLAVAFLVAFAVELGWRRIPRTAALVLAFALTLLLVYLAGFFNLVDRQSFEQWTKGLVKFAIHFCFLAAGVALLVRRSAAFFWRAVAFFAAGLVASSAYGVLQLGAARAGVNLDQRVLSPLTGGASAINRYGMVDGETIYRTNALAGDPNHLAVMLAIPLLTLLPVYLRLGRGQRWRIPLALVLGFLFLVQLSTLSRSGLLGDLVGLVVLAIPYRRRLVSRALLVPAAVTGVVLAAVVLRKRHFFDVVVRSRLETGGRSESAHLGVYDFVPQILDSHPLFGLGLNTFSVYYEFVTGKSNWGPHSFYVALIVETGVVGAIAFAAFLWFLFRHLRLARALGRRLAAAGSELAAQVRPLAWGMTAALAGTMAANAFYLTMQFYYFYAFAVLVLALPLVFAREARST